MNEVTASLWENIRPWLIEVMELLIPVFELFKGPELAVGLSLILLGLLVIALCFLLIRFGPMWFRLTVLYRLIDAHNNSYRTFKEAYSDINEALRKPRFIRHAWIEFTESLVIDSDDSNVPIHNTTRPHTYLNIESSETSGTSFRIFQVLPNYFVGFGLLFTFVGLIAAIYFASVALESRDIEMAQEGLQNLLHAATFKFMTSIAGLFSSIVLSWMHRLVMHELDVRFDRLCEALEKGMLYATPEAIAFQSLGELREHTGQLKRFNTDFAVEVGKVLEERIRESMTASLANAVKPLTEAIDQMAGNISGMNQDALEKITKTFGENLRGAAGTEMEALVLTLGNIKGSLDKVVEKVNETSLILGDRMAESTQTIKKMFGEVGDQFKDRTSSAATNFSDEIARASTNLSDSLSPLAEQIGRFEITINNLDAKMESQRDAFADVADRVREITNDVESTIVELREASSPLAEVSTQFAAAAREVGAAGEAIAQSQSEIRSHAEAIAKAAEFMESAWKDYQARFEGVDKSLAGAVEQLMIGADAYREHVQDFVSGLDRELDRAVRLLSGGISTLQETIEELIAHETNT